MSAGHKSLNLFHTVTDAVGLGAFENVLASLVVAAILVGVIFLPAKRALAKAQTPLVPDRGMTRRNLTELILGAVVKLGDQVMGKHNRQHLPFVATIFVFLLFSNLVSLVPGFSGPTDRIQFNAGIALTVFIFYNYQGIKAHGFVAYLKHFGGPLADMGKGNIFASIAFIALAIFVGSVEIVSHAMRPLTLSVRLFANMTADHSVLETFTDLTKVFIPVVFLVFGTLVSVIQAFVFTILAMIYISQATVHEESHAESH